MARILVIDDNRWVRSLVRAQLEAEGHEVVEAADGAEGLRLYHDRPADLVLCDLFIPGQQGLEMIRVLCRVGAARVIAMSGEGPVGSEGQLRAALLLGACGTLAKPFNLGELSQAVRDALAGQS